MIPTARQCVGQFQKTKENWNMKCKWCEYYCPYTVKTIEGIIIVEGCAKYNDDISNVVQYSKCGWLEI